MQRLREGKLALMLALLRAGLLAILLVAEETVDRRVLDSERFEIVFAVAVVYSLITIALSVRARDRPPGGWLPYAALDLACLAALTYESGGGLSQLRYAYSVIPVAVAFLGRPRQVVYASSTVIVVYLVVALVYPDADGDPLPGEIVVQALFLGWRAALALALSIALTSQRDRITGLATSRQVLVAQLQQTEEGERRRLAELLHDEPVQNLLACSHELARAERGQVGALLTAQEIVRDTTQQLRRAIMTLHPRALEQSGVEVALDQVAEELGRRAGTPIVVRADLAAGTELHDPALVFALGRELLTNAAKHAYGTRIELDLRCEPDGALSVTVSDDGLGFDASDLPRLLAAGHLGLVSVRERVEASGGRMSIETAPGEGTSVRVDLPVASLDASTGDAALLR